MSSDSRPFRFDINGLRAWAVLAVVFYHFDVLACTGGYVGVDVFFVISGFLMTEIVVRGLERGEPAGRIVRNFYQARVLRIMPALLVLCTVLLLAGWWILLPLDYKMLGTHAVFALTFLSNMKFWAEAGYFDAIAREKWLLHTWSLSVEWQFYLLLPLVLLTVWNLRPGRKAIVIAVSAGLFASFTASLLLTSSKPVAAFFLLPSRAWEMLTGAIVYLSAATGLRRTARERLAMEALGFGLILGALFRLNDASEWPGWHALIPVTGTALVLLSARPRSFWTGQPVMQWLGARSYSLYLWHWPVVVAIGYLELQSDVWAIFTGLALTLLLAHLSYHWVENPARSRIHQREAQTTTVALLCGALALAAMGGWIRSSEGAAWRLPAEIVALAAEAQNGNPRADECNPGTGIASPACRYGGNSLRAVIVGDSHASAVVTALAAALPQADDGVIELSYRACPTLMGAHPRRVTSAQCGAFVAAMLRTLERVPRDVPVIILNRNAQYAIGRNERRWESNIPEIYFSREYLTAEPKFLEEYSQHLTATACLIARERPVFLVRPIPEMGVDVPRTARALVWGRSTETSVSLEEYHRRQDFIWAAQDAARASCGVKILDPLPFLCENGRCKGTLNGRPLYSDSNHLSEFGNKLLVPMFREVLRP